MIRKFTIEQESVPVFRAALRAIPQPLASNAGVAGEIIFLHTTVFEEDYMTFCDNFVANSFYPPHARSEMRRRREAIQPHLGRAILHGGVSHAGFMLNVFVEKVSGLVIHWESQPEAK